MLRQCWPAICVIYVCSFCVLAFAILSFRSESPSLYVGLYLVIVECGAMWRKSGTDRAGKMRDRVGGHRGHPGSGGLERLRANSTDYTERIFHDEEFGEENVELVDEEWASFERVLR